MPIRLWPADTIFMAAVAEDIVVLDVAADAYLGLLDIAQWVRLQSDGSILVEDDEIAEDLEARGLVNRTPPAEPRRILHPATGDLDIPQSLSRLEVVTALVDIAHDTLAFRGKTLTQLIASAGPTPSPRPQDAPRLVRRAAAYRTALPWAPFEGECLQRGFQLKRLLNRQGLAADWVFGVTTWPFSAHCWLQTGGLVIGDRLERVRRYTPIMAV